MSILLIVIGSFVAGIFVMGIFRLGIKQGNILTQSTKKKKKPQKNQRLISEPVATDEEIANLVTDYGKYPEIWATYRTYGLIEAIKARDEKADFDRRLAKISKLCRDQCPND